MGVEPDLKSRVFNSGIVAIDVGPDKVRFDAHIELLCDCSLYFNELLKDRHIKPPDPIALDTDPDTFADFLCWAYQGKLQGAFKEKPTWIRLCRIWILGDKLRTRRLQNIVIRWFQNLFLDKRGIDEDAVQFIYNNTTKPSLLRDMAVDCYADSNPNWRQEFLDDLCSKVLPADGQSRNQDGLFVHRRSNFFPNFSLRWETYMFDDPEYRPLPGPETGYWAIVELGRVPEFPGSKTSTTRKQRSSSAEPLRDSEPAPAPPPPFIFSAPVKNANHVPSAQSPGNQIPTAKDQRSLSAEPITNLMNPRLFGVSPSATKSHPVPHVRLTGSTSPTAEEQSGSNAEPSSKPSRHSWAPTETNVTSQSLASKLNHLAV